MNIKKYWKAYHLIAEIVEREIDNTENKSEQRKISDALVLIENLLVDMQEADYKNNSKKAK